MGARILLLIAALALSACSEKISDHRFRSGDCAVIRITGEQAMVTRIYLYQRAYLVRVGAAEVIQSATFGPDVRDGNRQYATIKFDEFELDECPV